MDTPSTSQPDIDVDTPSTAPRPEMEVDAPTAPRTDIDNIGTNHLNSNESSSEFQDASLVEGTSSNSTKTDQEADYVEIGIVAEPVPTKGSLRSGVIDGDRDIPPAVQEKLQTLASERFEAMRDPGNPYYLSNRDKGSVLTVLMDSKTGEVYYATNSALPENLHPMVQNRLTDYETLTEGNYPPYKGEPGEHSEVIALNEALHARGDDVSLDDLSDFVLYNIRLRGAEKGEAIPRCQNCIFITDGVISLEDN